MAEGRYLLKGWPTHYHCHIELTPNGKTLIFVYPGKDQEMLFEGFIRQLGEPQESGFCEEHPDTLFLLFPHQNLPDDMKETAQLMMTRALLEFLGYEPEYTWEWKDL